MSFSDLKTLEKHACLESTPIAGLDEDSTMIHEKAKGCTGDPDSNNDLVRLSHCLEEVRQWQSLFRILNLTEPRLPNISIPPVPSSGSFCPY